MNITINQIFYTSSSESLFLKYEKIFKKAVKFRSFLQFPLKLISKFFENNRFSEGMRKFLRKLSSLVVF